jgi:hypothetical protein
VTGAGLAGSKVVIINAAIALIAALPTTPYAAALVAALAAKTAVGPSIGWPKVRGS